MTVKSQKIQNGIRIFLLLILGIPFLLIFTPFIVPILLAGFVAFGCEPILQKIQVRTKRRKYYTVGLFLALLLILLLPVFIFAARLAEGTKALSADSIQNSQFFHALYELWGKGQDFATKVSEMLGIEQNFLPQKDELFGKVSAFIVEKTSVLVSALPDLGLSLFVSFCSLFVLITGAKKIKARVLASNFLPEEEINTIIQTFQKACFGVLVSTILIGMLQAVIVATGSLIFGFHEFFLIFTVTFFLSFIPVIGAAPVAVLLATISLLMGSTGSGIGLLVIAVIAGSIDNILKPYIFSGDDDLHPVVSLLGIIGAIIVFGLPGLLLGPLLLQVTIKLVPELAEKIRS